jgi:hypothetical protein
LVVSFNNSDQLFGIPRSHLEQLVPEDSGRHFVFVACLMLVQLLNLSAMKSSICTIMKIGKNVRGTVPEADGAAVFRAGTGGEGGGGYWGPRKLKPP